MIPTKGKGFLNQGSGVTIRAMLFSGGTGDPALEQFSKFGAVFQLLKLHGRQIHNVGNYTLRRKLINMATLGPEVKYYRHLS